MKDQSNSSVLSVAAGLFLLAAPFEAPHVALAEDRLPPGEVPFENVQDERPHYLQLSSGKLLRVTGSHSETSADEGESWQQGGRVNPFMLGWKLDDVAIQLQSGKHQGRIVVPYYLGMYPDHPDYTSTGQGGYAIYKGETVLLETHTHIPEMSGSFVCYSDDEGQTWQCCVNKNARGFMMGYFRDGHMGHMTCEEPVVAELKDGRLLCYMRSTCGRILKSYSEDGGEHWMKVQTTDIAMSNSPCSLKRLPETGDLALVWNLMSADEIRKGYRRGRLSIAISRDDGDTWENVKTLELSPGLEPQMWVEPPPLRAMVRGPNGREYPMSEIPDGFTNYHYSSVFISEDKIFIRYSVNPQEGPGEVRWRVFPISWLYEPASAG